jgi:hypothetical protein
MAKVAECTLAWPNNHEALGSNYSAEEDREREINTYGKHWFPGNLKFRTLKYVYMIKHHLEIFK